MNIYAFITAVSFIGSILAWCLVMVLRQLVLLYGKSVHEAERRIKRLELIIFPIENEKEKTGENSAEKRI